MKRIVSLFVIALFVIGLCVIVNAGTDTTTGRTYKSGLAKSPGPGIIDAAGQPLGTAVKKYRVVRFLFHQSTYGPGGSGLGAGLKTNYRLSPDSIVIWDTSASGDDGVTVTTTTVTGDSRVAGVLLCGMDIRSVDASTNQLVATTDTDLNHWGFLQTHGLSFVNVEGNITSGDAIGTSNRAGCAGRFGTPLGTKSDFWNGISADAQYRGNAGFAFDDAAGSFTAAGANMKCKVFLRCE